MASINGSAFWKEEKEKETVGVVLVLVEYDGLAAEAETFPTHHLAPKREIISQIFFRLSSFPQKKSHSYETNKKQM